MYKIKLSTINYILTIGIIFSLMISFILRINGHITLLYKNNKITSCRFFVAICDSFKQDIQDTNKYKKSEEEMFQNSLQKYYYNFFNGELIDETMEEIIHYSSIVSCESFFPSLKDASLLDFIFPQIQNLIYINITATIAKCEEGAIYLIKTQILEKLLNILNNEQDRDIASQIIIDIAKHSIFTSSILLATNFFQGIDINFDPFFETLFMKLILIYVSNISDLSSEEKDEMIKEFMNLETNLAEFEKFENYLSIEYPIPQNSFIIQLIINIFPTNNTNTLQYLLETIYLILKNEVENSLNISIANNTIPFFTHFNRIFEMDNPVLMTYLMKIVKQLYYSSIFIDNQYVNIIKIAIEIVFSQEDVCEELIANTCFALTNIMYENEMCQKHFSKPEYIEMYRNSIENSPYAIQASFVMVFLQVAVQDPLKIITPDDIRIITPWLHNDDPNLVEFVLKHLNYIFEMEEKAVNDDDIPDVLLSTFIDEDGFEYIEELLQSQSEKVKKWATRLNQFAPVEFVLNLH